jgi:large subunit ribosomal protein L24
MAGAKSPAARPLHTQKLHVKTGDTVRIRAGKDRDRTGKLLRVDRAKGRVTVEGINLHKKFKKGAAKGQGEILEIPLPIDASNVMPMCPSCQATTRVKRERVEGKPVRVCRKCGEQY